MGNPIVALTLNIRRNLRFVQNFLVIDKLLLSIQRVYNYYILFWLTVNL